jgi:LPS sulfotransferase NodH
MPRPTAFVVFTSPRSGSSWLIDLLDSHPRIAAYAELFLPGDRTEVQYGSRDLPRFEATLDERRRLTFVPARLGYARRIFARRDGIGAAGFKLMYGHPHVHPGLLPYLAARRARAIHLVRENRLAQIVSQKTAEARGQFRAHEGEAVAAATIRLDIDETRQKLSELQGEQEQARQTLRRFRLAAHEVTYERIAASQSEELAGIAAFLGVEPRAWEARSTLAQMNPGSLRDIVQNVDEVEPGLAASGDAWMLG